ncbi:94_t:CDS:2 [Entrophospora sp. SA101]|nr:5448_t:CDS:2 [Entrophospora sp. SA101]CAJ0636085.1 4092_t:CDS:2 [Entrophospora sp. SA101]CAJ0749518.1 15306_t:CDS:2 [Entrophospora sp. SA101]CAJ0756101.1 94_t:CDS:2 [Entrophospora sp. SA101]CAJ0832777.1 14033_t:CDS:2 [Entrophospora sp. SA101]
MQGTTELNVHRVNMKIAKVRFALAHDASHILFAAGSWDQLEKNFLTFWSTEKYHIGLPDMTSHYASRMVGKIVHKGEVTDIKFLNENILLSTSSHGHLNVYKYTMKSNESEPGVTSDVYIEYELEELMNKQLHSFPNNINAEATAIAVQPNELYDPEILTAGEDGKLVFLRLGNPNDSQIIQVGSFTIKATIWPSSDQIITASSSGILKIFDKRNIRKPTFKFYDSAHPRDPVNCLAATSSHIYQVASGSSDGFVTIWDARNLTVPWKQFKPDRKTKNVWELIFDPYDSGKIISCSEDGFIATTDLKDTSLTEKLTTQNFSINSIDCHQYARILVGGGDSAYIFTGELNL